LLQGLRPRTPGALRVATLPTLTRRVKVATLKAVLEQAVNCVSGPLKRVKIDTDQNQALAVSAGLSSIPDVCLFVGGKQVAGFTGFRPKPAVDKFLSNHLTYA
jgi:thioredoxin-like negative regulator of GroEL